MLAYIFSAVFIVTLVGMIRFYQKKSKPTQLYLNPKSAKAYMFDQYWKIEQMSTGNEKENARREWRLECAALQQKLQPESKALGVKVID